MKSRHTTMSGRLTRSFWIEGTEDFVVELVDDGQIIFRKEPADRKIKRGEQLPERRLDIREVMRDLDARPKGEIEATAIIERLLEKAPIAKFEEEPPRSVAYAMKVWLIKELKRIVTKEEEPPDTEQDS
jgi:hypothetical protein